MVLISARLKAKLRGSVNKINANGTPDVSDIFANEFSCPQGAVLVDKKGPIGSAD